MTSLKGKNRIKEFRQVAERLASRISAQAGVAGIIFLGGLTRKFADEFSDIDITVFLIRKDDELRKRIRKLGLEEQKISRLDIDLMIHSLVDFRKYRLDEAEKWDFSKAQIIYDPKGETAQLLKRKLQISERFWLNRIAESAEYVKWYCCPSGKDAGTIGQAWVERGDTVSAHYCLNYTIDLILQVLFALNREFLPAQKWRVFYSYDLRHVPADFRRLVEEATLVRSLSAQDFHRRTKAVRRLWSMIIPEIEQETGYSLERLSEHYVKTILCQKLD